MTAWTPSGYPGPSAFPDAFRCRYRLCHARHDVGLFVTTLGDRRTPGGRLEPLMDGFNYLTLVTLGGDEDGQAQRLEIAACQDWRTADAQHAALIEKYRNWQGEVP